jgi:hypothetical protein
MIAVHSWGGYRTPAQRREAATAIKKEKGSDLNTPGKAEGKIKN